MKNKEIEDKEIIEKRLLFECPKCGPNSIFRLEKDYCNGYGELSCPMCFTHKIKVIIKECIEVKRNGRK